jgi:hypothetical protein
MKGPAPPTRLAGPIKLICQMLWLGHRILHRLAKAELDGRFCRDTDHGAGRGVATIAGLSVRLLEFSEAGKGEFTIRLYFVGCEFGKSIEHCLNVRFLASAGIRETADDLRLCHTSHSLSNLQKLV